MFDQLPLCAAWRGLVNQCSFLADERTCNTLVGGNEALLLLGLHLLNANSCIAFSGSSRMVRATWVCRRPRR